MNRYRVYGTAAKFGPGQLMHLSGEQIKARARLLELPAGYQIAAKDNKSKPPKAEPADVKATATVEFKVGEIVSLPDLPSPLVNNLQPLDPPKSKNDEKAAAKYLEVKTQEAAARREIERRQAAAAKVPKAKAA